LLEQQLPDEEGSLWFLKPNDTLPKRRKIWQPDLVDVGQMKRLLPVLFPLARGLHLGCFDGVVGIYFPPEMMYKPIPEQERIQYRVEFDQEYSCFIKKILNGGSGKTEQWTRDSVTKYMDENLAPILAKHGFTPYPEYYRRFQRIINGGYQEIKVTPRSHPYVMPLNCFVTFEQHSERLLAMRTKYDDFGNGLMDGDIDWLSKIFIFDLDDYRRMEMPGWNRLGKLATQLTLSKEEIDWAIDDIVSMGLAFLNRFRVFTVDDADRLFNECNELEDTLFKATRVSAWATIYARLAGKRDFEEVIRRYKPLLDADVERKYYARVVDACRNDLQAVDGSEPA
jgi:hypothetical protein